MAQPTCRRAAVASLAIVTLAGGRVFAQQNSTSPAASPQLGALLDAWVQHSSQIKSFSVTFKRRDERPGFGAQQYIYKILWTDSGRAIVQIEWLDKKDKAELGERFIWTGREVWTYTAHGKKKEILVRNMDQIHAEDAFTLGMKASWGGRLAGNQFDVIFPLLSDPKQIDPLPFWVGMKELVAKKQFSFTLLDASDPERPVLRATPVRTDSRSSDRDILITLDRAHGLPIAVSFQRGWRDKDKRQFTVVEAHLNPPISDAAFEPPKPAGWEIKYESQGK
jgi:hypothetical protein